jgi:rod shape-determining protein MreC
MRNIFLFVKRYFTFLSFVALQILALSFLFRYNKYHRAVGLGKANEITGWFNSKYANVDEYFHMRKENKIIHKMNDSLLNARRGNFLDPDTASNAVTDSIPFDTLGHMRRYLWRDAEVVSNSVTFDKNYIQLNRGSLQGIKDNMSVLNADGSLVGIIVGVSNNFSEAMSLLHVQNRVSAIMKKSGNSGTISWDGTSPLLLTLKGIPKSDSVAKGDTVLTSEYSLSFPPRHIIGTVESIETEKSSSTFYILKIRTASNFQNIHHVFVVENLQRDEQDQLDKDTRKKIEEPKKTGR